MKNVMHLIVLAATAAGTNHDDSQVNTTLNNEQKTVQSSPARQEDGIELNDEMKTRIILALAREEKTNADQEA